MYYSKALIADTISEVTLLIQDLIKFKNENYIRVGSTHRFSMEIKTFMKKGLRYRYWYRNFVIENKHLIETFATHKTYKSINRFLHDLKKYRNELQRKYSEAEKVGLD